MTANNHTSLVFFGTPEIAVASLRILQEGGFMVAAVVTPPDRRSGRGLQMQPSPVKQYAVGQGLMVLQPESLKDPGFLSLLREINPDMQVVVAFRKLPEEVWKLPVLGTFNLHASLLPDYRGAAPINWTLINGDHETGLTTFLINEEIDQGKVLLQEKVPVYFSDTAGTLHNRMMEKGAMLVLETANRLAAKDLLPVSQPSLLPDGQQPRQAPKIYREDCRIPWAKSKLEVYNFIRGLSPEPGAFSDLIDDRQVPWMVKILSAELADYDVKKEPGSILTDGRSYCLVATGEGWVKLNQLQLQGRKLLSVNNLLNGFPLKSTWRFST